MEKGKKISILTLHTNFTSTPEENSRWMSDIPSLVLKFYKILRDNKFEIGQKKKIWTKARNNNITAPLKPSWNLILSFLSPGNTIRHTLLKLFFSNTYTKLFLSLICTYSYELCRQKYKCFTIKTYCFHCYYSTVLICPHFTSSAQVPQIIF